MITQLPEYIYTGIDSMGHLFDFDYKKILVISDSYTKQISYILPDFLKKAYDHSVNAQLIVNDDPVELFDAIEEKLADETSELIVAVGDGKTIDCAAAVSSMSQTPFCAIPVAAPSALWENDKVEAFVNRKIPSICFLDPEMIVRTDSRRIAYEGLGMLTLCAESCFFAENRYVKTIAISSFRQIYENLFDAFNGEISARENLLEGMYWAYIAFVNSHNFSWESPCYRICEFFKSFGADALSVLAVSCVQITNSFSQNQENLSREMMRDLFSEDKTALSLVQEMRRLRAKLSVASCIKNLNIDESEFVACVQESGEEDAALFEKCFYPEFETKRKNAVFLEY